MNEQVDRSNYDVVSITRQGKAKRESFVQEALYIEKSRIATGGQFVKIFSDMFLKKEAGFKAYR